MVSTFRKEFISLLSQSATTKEYFGELANPKKPLINKNDVPLILVDFTGDQHINIIEKEVFFSLYIIHVSYSKNADNRTEKENKVLDLISKIDDSIQLVELAGYEGIRLKRLQKIYDGVSEVGYLTVYMRNISIKKGVCE